MTAEQICRSQTQVITSLTSQSLPLAHLSFRILALSIPYPHRLSPKHDLRTSSRKVEEPEVDTQVRDW